MIPHEPPLLWKPDPGRSSANRAEHAVVGAYELMAYDLPADSMGPRLIGWEIFTGPKYDKQVAIGETATFNEAKEAAEAAWRKLTAAPARPAGSSHPIRGREP
jgi:hypothetical protein